MGKRRSMSLDLQGKEVIMMYRLSIIEDTTYEKKRREKKGINFILFYEVF